MDRTLRKTPVPVSVQYSNDFSNNLRAGPIIARRTPHSVPYIVLDMTCNLRKRNKRENTYTDACELGEKHLDVRKIQICDEVGRKVMDFLFAEGIEKRFDARVQIILGEKSFTYFLMSWHEHNGDLFLGVSTINKREATGVSVQ